VAQQYGIHAIPTLIIFKNGQEVERLVGYLPKRSIEQKLKAVV
jgi:thioredoxin 1